MVRYVAVEVMQSHKLQDLIVRPKCYSKHWWSLLCTSLIYKQSYFASFLL